MLSLILYILFLIPSFFFMGWWLTFIFIGFGFFYFFSFFSFNHVFSLISYSFGGDVISMCFIFLSVWIVLLMILASNSIYMSNNFKGEFFLICLFLLIFLVLSFSSSNMLLFYIFFESSLIPTVFLIFGWGYQPERVSAGFYLLFYTLFASLPLLIGIFYCYSISFTLWFFLININSSFYFYLSMISAFMVKMPMIFVHFWLPKAHVEAPIAGSMVLAGVLLKLGGYGLIRVFMFITGPVILMNDYFVCLSLFGIVLVGFICLFQTDIKSLIAYSSVSHMGLVICGIFTMNFWGLYGSLILMIGHGLCSSALFCLSNIVYERLGSRSFYINKGLITLMPTMSLFWFLLCSNNIPCPPSLNLIGEIFLINSVMSWSSLSFMYLALGSFLSCCYSAYLYSVTQHGGIYSGVKPMSSGNVREFILLYFHWFPLNLIIFKCDIFMLLF